MGCASSKQQRKRCRNCHAPYSPVHRSYSMDNEIHHIVALKSTTLGSLKLDPYREDTVRCETKFISNSRSIGSDRKGFDEEEKETEYFRTGLIEAKTWSHMIEEKIPKPAPKTPSGTPPGEPETINTWELMEGLEESTPIRSPTNLIRSFSFDVVKSPGQDSDHPSDRPRSRFRESMTTEAEPPRQQPMSMWLQMNEDDDCKSNDFKTEYDPDFKSEQPSHKEQVIVYFTSLRGVRKTYEDCCHVRVILKGAGVRIDERDVSMHLGFKEELKQLLVERLSPGGGYGLPRVFMGKKCIGGAEEIQRMHEDGKLNKLLEGCERAGVNVCEENNYACEACGDVRFMPCETCSGSCKVFYGDNCDKEEEDQEHERHDLEDEEFGFKRCPNCNENGLVQCPICCD